jgi:hypothetical protein
MFIACYACPAQATKYIKYIYQTIDYPTMYRACCDDCFDKRSGIRTEITEEEYIDYQIVYQIMDS